MAYKGLAGCIADPVTVTAPEKLSCCKALLCLSVEPSVYVHIQKCGSALEIWKKLKELYEDKGLTRKIGILRGLISTRLDDSDGMQNDIDKIKCNANKLAGIGFDIDEWLTAIILAGLTDAYGPFIMGLEASGGTISTDGIISKLLDTSVNCSENDAFVCKNKKKHGKKNFKNRKCFKCGSGEHLANACNKKSESAEKSKNNNVTKNAFMMKENIAFLILETSMSGM